MLPVQKIPTPKYGVGYFETLVSPESVPYLTSSSKGMLWVERPRRGSVIWSVLSPFTSDELFEQVCALVFERSKECQWGSVVSSEEEATAYLSEYGVDEVDFLNVGPYRVGIPVDKSFLGLCWGGENCHAMLIHDPSRMMTIVCAG